MAFDNFSFLRTKFPSLAFLGSKAEQYVQSDPNSSLLKAGMLGESLVNLIYTYTKEPLPPEKYNNAKGRINNLHFKRFLSDDMANFLHKIREMRNKAAHEGFSSQGVAKIILQMTFSVSQWFMKVYGDPNFQFQRFVDPVEEQVQSVIKKTEESSGQKLDEEHKERELIEQDRLRAGTHTVQDREKIKAASIQASLKRPKDERETRMLIDMQLQEVGWEADTENLRYAKGARPEKGRNLAIAEWPTKPVTADNRGKCYADYALFIGLKLVGFIEAKAFDKDISTVIDDQCKFYASHVRKEDEQYAEDNFGGYRVPFVFAANGRSYLEQYKEKSGIWALDLRRSDAKAQALRGWPSPQNLLEKLAEDVDIAVKRLQEEPLDALLDPDGLNLRPYQVDAVRAVEKSILNGQEKILLAMATGTGKTRTVLGIIYRMLKSGRFNRILYLVDRNSLGEQTQDVFSEVRLERKMPLSSIYNIRKLGDLDEDIVSVSVQVSTVQSMVRRILNYEADGDGAKPAVGDFDLVIIDEAHRGYILDKELSDEEMLYSDQKDFQSKYRSVVDYFSAVKVAMTATPAMHTVTIFGEPVYTYSYRQAVMDGMLVDFDAPHVIKTKLSESGIHYQKGEELEYYDLVSQTVDTMHLDDELNFDVEQFNKTVITENFNREVLKTVAADIDPESPDVEGKTLIYAVNDAHADQVVNILREIYSESGLDNDAIVKITGRTGDGDQKKIREQIRRFKSERYPSIVVTVDLLTTGIDIPQITRLVFLRAVKSRILFEQMLGRATRLCPEIGKDHFEIYDAVGACEAMNSFTNMKPVVQKPNESFSELIERLKTADSDDEAKFQAEAVIAKLRRKQKVMDEEAIAHFKDLSGKTPEEFIRTAAHQNSPALVKQFLIENEEYVKALDRIKARKGHIVVVSHDEDELTAHERLYLGNYGEKYEHPEDYLEAFDRYLKENRESVEILNLICTRPRDLSRQSLKSLLAKLDEAGFSKQQLSSALKSINTATDEEMSFDIISIVRNIAINEPLEDHKAKVMRAVKELKQRHHFSKQEENWLKRFEQILLNDDMAVLNAETLDTDVRFKSQGGFKRINTKYFEGKLSSYLDEFNDIMFNEHGKASL